jgi:hypothetical protein
VERVISPAAARVAATPWCGGGPLIVHGGTRDAWTARIAPAGVDGWRASGAALSSGDVAKRKGEKQKEGVTGGRRLTPGATSPGSHLSVSRGGGGRWETGLR